MSWPLLEPETPTDTAPTGQLRRLYLPVLRAFFEVRGVPEAAIAGARCGAAVDVLLSGPGAAPDLRSDHGWLRRLVLREGTAAVPDRGSALQATSAEGPAASVGEGVFDVLWARQLVRLAVDRTRLESLAAGQERCWRAFEARVLLPALRGSAPPSYGECLREAGIADPVELCLGMATAGQRLERALRKFVGCGPSQDAVEPELALLSRRLAEAGIGGAPVPATGLPAAHDIAGPAGDWLLLSSRLDPLFRASTAAAAGWPAESLAELYRLQLDRPIRAGSVEARSIRSVLLDPGADREAVTGIKEDAKTLGQNPYALPKEIPRVIYVLAIAAGFVYLGRSITSLGWPQIERLLSWALALQWLDADARNLLRGCRAHLASRSGKSAAG